MKILDCFGFCGENEILEIRLETLFEYVDKFVIIEGNKFFNGTGKKKLFDILFYSGRNFTDLHNGLRVFTHKSAYKLNLSANGMEHASLITESIAVNKLKYIDIIKY